MDEYLGETEIAIADTNFRGYKPTDWVMLWIERYGGIDGEHHKTWVIDQIARILHGTPVEAKIAKWHSFPSEIRLNLGEPSPDYIQWVKNIEDSEDGYTHDCGIAP